MTLNYGVHERICRRLRNKLPRSRCWLESRRSAWNGTAEVRGVSFTKHHAAGHPFLFRNHGLFTAKAEHNPLASHIFVSRRRYRNIEDTKSGKRREMTALSSFNIACDLRFRGSLDEWERLMGAVVSIAASSDSTSRIALISRSNAT
jgi:hypothetical protein